MRIGTVSTAHTVDASLARSPLGAHHPLTHTHTPTHRPTLDRGRLPLTTDRRRAACRLRRCRDDGHRWSAHGYAVSMCLWECRHAASAAVSAFECVRACVLRPVWSTLDGRCVAFITAQRTPQQAHRTGSAVSGPPHPAPHTASHTAPTTPFNTRRIKLRTPHALSSSPHRTAHHTACQAHRTAHHTTRRARRTPHGVSARRTLHGVPSSPHTIHTSSFRTVTLHAAPSSVRRTPHGRVDLTALYTQHARHAARQATRTAQLRTAGSAPHMRTACRCPCRPQRVPATARGGRRARPACDERGDVRRRRAMGVGVCDSDAR